MKKKGESIMTSRVLTNIGIVFIMVLLVVLLINKRDSSDTYSRNIQCVQFKNNIVGELSNRSTSQAEYFLIDIFYSPKENECYYAYEIYLTSNNVNYTPGGDNRTESVIKTVGSGFNEDYARFQKDRYNGITETYFYQTISELKNKR